jgi:hypothetical protein
MRPTPRKRKAAAGLPLSRAGRGWSERHVLHPRFGRSAKPRLHVVLFHFGSLAVITNKSALDPWLCVPGFRRVCPYR